jgi:hypothetical protein
MNVFAYCAFSFAAATRKAAGVDPLTCPPLSADSFDPGILKGRDFIYFDLHGLPNTPYWYEELPGPIGLPERTIAVWDHQIKQAHLGGAVVFVANCFLADGPMLQALLDAGAGHVVGGAGLNYGGKSRPDGANELGRLFRLNYQKSGDAVGALAKAKRVFRFKILGSTLRGGERASRLQDTLDFRIFDGAK